jgi:hypothetical protein
VDSRWRLGSAVNPIAVAVARARVGSWQLAVGSFGSDDAPGTRLQNGFA